MPKKRIQCNFFKLSEPPGLAGTIDRLLENQKKVLEQGKVVNVEVSGVILRITFLRKNTSDSKHWWTGIIERLDVTEQAEISNLEGVKTVYGTKEDEGPITNTGFAYYPLTSTVVLHKKIGGVNDSKFGVFIRKLLRETNTVQSNSSKFVLDILPDLTKLDRLFNASQIKKLEYSFAMPENITHKKSSKRSIFGDIFLASSLGGQNIKVQIRADQMDIGQTIAKVKQLLTLGEDVGTLKAITEHNEIEEPLDLLSNRFTDYIDVDLKKGQKETVVLIMDTVDEIFLNQRTLIQKMYLNEEDEE